MEIGGRQMCNVGARVDSVLYTLVHIPETITANKERGPLIFGPSSIVECMVVLEPAHMHAYTLMRTCSEGFRYKLN